MVSHPLSMRKALGYNDQRVHFVTLEATRRSRKDMGGSFARKAPCGDQAHEHTLAKRVLWQLS
jgi:hypothetical protein